MVSATISPLCHGIKEVAIDNTQIGVAVPQEFIYKNRQPTQFSLKFAALWLNM